MLLVRDAEKFPQALGSQKPGSFSLARFCLRHRQRHISHLLLCKMCVPMKMVEDECFHSYFDLKSTGTVCFPHELRKCLSCCATNIEPVSIEDVEDQWLGIVLHSYGKGQKIVVCQSLWQLCAYVLVSQSVVCLHICLVCFTLLQYMCVCFLASLSYLFIWSVSWSVTLSLVNQSHCPTVVCLLFRCVWSSLFLCLDLPLPACLPVCLSPSVCLYVCLSVSFSQPWCSP